MNIVPTNISDAAVLNLFSKHDDFMQDFLGKDKACYTRYSPAESIEKVWLAFEENMPIGCVAYRTKSDDTGEVKRLFIKSKYRGNGISKALLSEVKTEVEEISRDTAASGAVFGKPTAGQGGGTKGELSEAQKAAISKRDGAPAEGAQPF